MLSSLLTRNWILLSMSRRVHFNDLSNYRRGFWPTMNIAESEQQANIIAKTSGAKEKGTNKITYSFIDASQSLSR